VGDILDLIVDAKYTISDKLWEGHQRRKRENKLKGKGFGYGIFNSIHSTTVIATLFPNCL
jgi:DNA (cytosine-5)-methyltransferase 1